MCNFCEDNGDSLTCEVRGYSAKLDAWNRVPLYPRDMLGELYRGEWRDTFNRPKFASITILKKDLMGDIKDMPSYMVKESEAMDAVKMASASEALGGGVKLPG